MVSFNASSGLPPSAGEDKVVIALDFGTTYSGIAYAFVNPGVKPEVVAIVDWPGQEGQRKPKIPTLVSYDTKDASKFRWGAQVDWREDSVRGVKLLLDPDQAKPDYFPSGSLESQAKNLPKDAVDIAADFIGAIYSHALKTIENSGIISYFKMCQKEYVLSVPAIWSDKAMTRTLRAAKKAGFHPVTLIKEPEAAALYTLSVQERALEIGDAFVVCDAGGGTVDLITYEILQLTPTFEVAEVVQGSGGMAGSLGLNKRFEEAVRGVVGLQFSDLKKGVGWAKALREFDRNIKTAFNGDVTDEYYLSFPKARLMDNPSKNLFADCWTIEGKDMLSIFDPLMKDIINLVDYQVQTANQNRQGREVKGIFLVGGFGSSNFLMMRLQNQYPSIQVIQPHDAWGAIVKGAVLSRLPNQVIVTSVKAVRHYGVSAFSEIRTLADHGEPTSIDRYDGKSGIMKMTWFICKGSDMKRNEKIKFPFYRNLDFKYYPDDLVFHDELEYCEMSEAPAYPGEEVKRCCKLSADLTTVKNSYFEKAIGKNGVPYWKVNYLLAVETKAANMTFSLEIDNKTVGSVTANYE